jgi:hypothetical protein
MAITKGMGKKLAVGGGSAAGTAQVHQPAQSSNRLTQVTQVGTMARTGAFTTEPGTVASHTIQTNSSGGTEGIPNIPVVGQPGVGAVYTKGLPMRGA